MLESYRRLPFFRAGVAIFALAVVAGCSPSAEKVPDEETSEASAPAGEMISLPSGEDTIDGYLARPAGDPKAIVIVIHEWWGLNAWIKSVADRMAGLGYLAIAPDLYRGEVATEAEEAHELSRGLPEERAVADVRAAARHARSLVEMADSRIGVVGFCMGGRLALISSLDGGPFQATVVCYGRPVTTSERLSTLPGPLLGIYGADDKGIGPEQVEALEKGLEAAGKQHEILVMENAGHAFMNSDRPNSFAPEATARAWQQIEGFFRRSLEEPAG